MEDSTAAWGAMVSAGDTPTPVERSAGAATVQPEAEALEGLSGAATGAVEVIGVAAATVEAAGTGEVATAAAMEAAGTEAGHPGDTGLGAIVLITIRGPSPSDSARGLDGRVTTTIPIGSTIIPVIITQTLVTGTTILSTIPVTFTDLLSARQRAGQLHAVTTPDPARSLATDDGIASTSVTKLQLF